MYFILALAIGFATAALTETPPAGLAAGVIFFLVAVDLKRRAARVRAIKADPAKRRCRTCGGDGKVLSKINGSVTLDRCHSCRGRGWHPVKA